MGRREVNHPRIPSIGTVDPPVKLTQEGTFHSARYQGERIRKVFLNTISTIGIFIGKPHDGTSVDEPGDSFARASELAVSSPSLPVVTFF